MRKIKLVCVFAFAVFGAIVLTVDNPFVQKVSSFSSGPPAGFTGAPGENDCAACHTPNTHTGGQFTILPPPEYIPGQTYEVRVRHTSPDVTRLRWGFELTALDSENFAAGTFANLSENTQTLEQDGRFYIEHTSAGTFPGQTGGSEWAFNWTAPATDIGPVTFYAGGNQANNDESPDGDQIYLTFASSSVGGTPTPTPTATPCSAPVTVANTGAIAINDLAAANPYPSTISVPTAFPILGMSLKLNGFSHSSPDDVDILLVGPGGQTAVVMSDVGGTAAASGINLTLDDNASEGLPNTRQLVSGTFKPTNIGGGDMFSAPAPQASSSSTLSVFNGTAANGTWSLYIVDDNPESTGTLSGGWELTFFVPAPCPTPTATPTPTPPCFTVSTLNGANEVPPNGSAGTGTGTVFTSADGSTLTVDLSFSGLGTNATAAHIHGPAAAGTNGPIVFGLAGVPNGTAGSIPQQTFNLNATQRQQFQEGLFYFNVHTTGFSGGEIRGQITPGPCLPTPTPTPTPSATPTPTATPTPQFLLTVTVDGSGTGQVASLPGGIVCPGDCTELYDQGTNVALSVTPTGGSTFGGWSGDCTGLTPCQVTMTQARNVTATFNAATPTPTPTPTPTATPTPTPTLTPTPTATLTPTPTPQPEFDLRIGQVDTPDPVWAGQHLMYTITVSIHPTALGGSASPVVRFDYPTGVPFDFIAAGATNGFVGTPDASGITFAGGTISTQGPNPGIALLDVTIRPLEAGSLTSNAVVVDPANLIAETDETNNTAPSESTTVNTGNVPFDYDADGRTDFSVFRPSQGAWYLQKTTEGFFGMLFGFETDRIAPADYDGDGKTDIAVFRPSDLRWYIANSSDGTYRTEVFGLANDLPAPADYDGDGKADICVFRPSDGTWYLQRSSNGSFFAFQFGSADDKPTVGDWDGDGRSDFAVFRTTNGEWYQHHSSDGSIHGEQFGFTTDRLAYADYDGDSKTDLAIYRPDTRIFYIKNSGNSTYDAFFFGISEDIPTPGDYDGDGKADLSVFRPSDGNWYRQNSSNGTFNAFQFGLSGDRPTPTAYQ